MKYRNKKTGEIVEATQNDKFYFVSMKALPLMREYFERTFSPLPEETTMEQVDKTENQKLGVVNDIKRPQLPDLEEQRVALLEESLRIQAKTIESINKRVRAIENMIEVLSNSLKESVIAQYDESRKQTQFLRDNQLTKREQVALSILNGQFASDTVETIVRSVKFSFEAADEFLKQSKEDEEK